MRKVKLLLCVFIFLDGWVAVAAPPETVTLAVKNMTCELCPITVKKALEKVPGVSTVSVNFDKKTATVIFDPDKANPEMMTKATTDEGYPSVMGKE
ncbi:MAG: mercury resistance system periplasmic binding protein MerP [Nitrospira sp.]